MGRSGVRLQGAMLSTPDLRQASPSTRQCPATAGRRPAEAALAPPAGPALAPWAAAHLADLCQDGALVHGGAGEASGRLLLVGGTNVLSHRSNSVF